MNAETQRNRMICKRCGEVFDIKNAAIKYRKLYNVQIPEKKCPTCGGNFQAVELPEDLDKYLYVNGDDRYYNYYK